MPETLRESIDDIKKLEQKITEDGKEPALLKRVSTAFKGLQKLKDGPLAYLDITTTEEMIHLYDVDTESEYEELQRKEVGLKGGTNPNNYAVLPSDIRLIVIERTPRNEEIARTIVKKIIAALGGKE